MERPSRDEVLLGVARLVALRGTCSRLMVGAVASVEGRILSTGYNGAPSGLEHCNHYCICKGQHSELNALCPNRPCTRAVHAEANTIAFAAYHGVSLRGADLHSTHSPCLYCSQLIVNSGIVRVAYDVEFREIDGLGLLEEAGIRVDQLEVIQWPS